MNTGKPMTWMASLGVDRLPADEQLRLVEEILAGLEDHSEFVLTDAQKEMLSRRIAALEDGTVIGIPWEEVKARILAKLGAGKG
jgi:putative addiction module component (TIGR02574 family)